MKEFRGGIIRLFEQGKSGYKKALHHTEQKKLEIWSETSSIYYREGHNSPLSETGNYNDRPRSERQKFVRFMCGGLLIMEHFGKRSMSKPHQSIEALKKSLVKAWNAIPQEVIGRAVDDFPKRLKKCIDAQGGHFENK
uniref:Uncharacterized protein n=1 Tax=Acrobeloides nanus TaxID=290746 RepID=A0A914DAA6_9BILA